MQAPDAVVSKLDALLQSRSAQLSLRRKLYDQPTGTWDAGCVEEAQSVLKHEGLYSHVFDVPSSSVYWCIRRDVSHPELARRRTVKLARSVN